MQFCSVIYGRLKKTKKNKHKKLLYKMGEADLWGIKGVLKGYLGFFLLLCEGAATWYMHELSFHITNWQTDKQPVACQFVMWKDKILLHHAVIGGSVQNHLTYSDSCKWSLTSYQGVSAVGDSWSPRPETLLVVTVTFKICNVTEHDAETQSKP